MENNEIEKQKKLRMEMRWRWQEDDKQYKTGWFQVPVKIEQSNSQLFSDTDELWWRIVV